MKMHEMMVLNAATCVLALVTQSVLGQEAQLAADRAEQRGGIAAPMRAAVRAGGRAAEKLSAWRKSKKEKKKLIIKNKSDSNRAFGTASTGHLIQVEDQGSWVTSHR